MKFTCDRDALVKELSTAQDVVVKAVMNITSNVLMEVSDGFLQILATDNKIWFKTRLPIIEAESGKVAISCDMFTNFIRKLPAGNVVVSTENDKFLIKSQMDASIKIQLNTQSSDGFPVGPVYNDNAFFKLKQKDLLEMITQTAFAVSDDETRIFMNGVYLEKENRNLIAVATDGRRLSYVTSEQPDISTEFSGVIIPPAFLRLIKKLAYGEGELQIAIVDRTIFVNFDNVKLSSMLIDGAFPNYKRVIPEHQIYNVEFDKSTFLDAVGIVSIAADQKVRRIFILFEAGKATISAGEKENFASREIPCDYTGPELKMALNFGYLNDPLKVIKTEKFILEFSDANKAITLAPTSKTGYFHIIMPMQPD